MMSANGLFYGQLEPEPVWTWVIDTAASQTIVCRPATPPPPPPPADPPAPPPGPPAPEFRVLDFMAPLCCEGCVERVVKHLLGVEGVEGVHCNSESQIVTVEGYTPPELVLKAVRKQFKREANFWPPPPPPPAPEKPPEAQASAVEAA